MKVLPHTEQEETCGVHLDPVVFIILIACCEEVASNTFHRLGSTVQKENVEGNWW